MLRLPRSSPIRPDQSLRARAAERDRLRNRRRFARVTRRARAGNTAAAHATVARRDALWVLYRDPAALVELPFSTLRLPGGFASRAPDSFRPEPRGRAAIASGESQDRDRLTRQCAPSESSTGRRAFPSALPGGCPADYRRQPARAQLGIFRNRERQVVVRLPLPLEPRHFCFKRTAASSSSAATAWTPWSSSIRIGPRLPRRCSPAARPTAWRPGFPPFLWSPIRRQQRHGSRLRQDGEETGGFGAGRQEPRAHPGHARQAVALVLNEKSGDMAVIRMLFADEPGSDAALTGSDAAVHDDPGGRTARQRGVVAFT